MPGFFRQSSKSVVIATGRDSILTELTVDIFDH